MQPNDIKQLIEANLPDCTVTIKSGDNKHYNATVISPVFREKNRVQKQQLVYNILHEPINSGQIHAISLKTLTPEEWQTTSINKHE